MRGSRGQKEKNLICSMEANIKDIIQLAKGMLFDSFRILPSSPPHFLVHSHNMHPPSPPPITQIVRPPPTSLSWGKGP
jgi:hypothetical protein